MEYGYYQLGYPMKLVECGHFITKRGWTHKVSTRKSDTEILIGLSGDIPLAIGSEKFNLTAGKVLINFPTETIFGSTPVTVSSDFFWIHIINQAPLNIAKEGPTKPIPENLAILPRSFQMTEPDRCLVLATQLLDIAHHQGHASSADYAATLLVTELANDYLNQVQSDTTDESKVMQIKEWSRLNINKELTVRTIADHFEINQNYLAAIFKKVTGSTVKKYLNKLKIDQAKYLLLTTTLSVQEISEKSYFNDYKYFFRIFKKNTNLTPAKYRNTFTSTFLNNPDIDPGYDIGKIVSVLEKGIDEKKLF
ncbi:helix-turn-helix domain-containing protein [Lentilactobacillus sp. TOM.63]|uniref:helix-turn-helix domain-containing protein n=1 Tax=Lentilactobacillus TaxID=2767893 RepID=UPI001C26C8E0|nr:MULTISPECIES: helix-turn-helix domain-containing protein [Lentilactobacillus]MBU9788826.1 helix-turn-helix domain-containing protein [Lentilactobacillus dabitei]MDM7515498.1 helix-turn-helix domain-containing protein [Lentilactobacillus sp. TOM.63]